MRTMVAATLIALYGCGRWDDVLCELNVSCVFPFPDEALGELARVAVTQATAARRARLQRTGSEQL